MIKFVLRRFLELLLALFLIATATFFLTAAAPGDPLLSRTLALPEASRDAMYAKYGLDKPVLERYVITMKGMLHGDFGESVVYQGQTLQTILRDKLPVSARLGLQQLIFGVLVGLLLGVIAAVKRETWIDRCIVVFAVLMMSVPELVLGLIFQKYFAGTLKLLPVIGWPTGKDLWFGGWKYTILPTLSGGLLYIATYSRLLKTSILDVLDQDYILTARSKGLSEPRIVWSHIMRNSMIPIVTRLPVTLAMCLTGSFMIEKIFAIPGIAAYFVEAVSANDLSIVLGETVFLAALFITVIFLTDILYTIVDPRIRIQGGKR
ncbi:MAG: ABC transporter permease [Oscillospiraceae bacterium]|nr:ABC transporter permease [Oscillospiraceae bacterium]